MTRIALTDRVRVAIMRAHGLGRRASSGLLRSRLQRWPQGLSGSAIVLAPQDLRTRDLTFWREIETGSFGLSGNTVTLKGRSPFDVPAPSRAWPGSLNGFSWLRHLEAVEDTGARETARRYVLDWLKHPRRHDRAAAQPAVRARRVISLLAHAPFLLEGASAAEFDTLTGGICREVSILSGTWRQAREGYPRLLALTALVTAALSLAGRDRELAAIIKPFQLEVCRQITTDGSHTSRSPAVLVELLLDWLPLKACFDSRDLRVPEELSLAIGRMLVLLRFLKLGDGGIGRFNGIGVADPSALAILSAYDDSPLPAAHLMPAARYARMEAGATIVLADAGSPPPLTLSGLAHAGPLSFEMSSGSALLFVNCGSPAPLDQNWLAVARATASHTTMCVCESSAARLVRHRALEDMLEAVPLQLPGTVTASMRSDADGHHLEGQHDGYLQRFGLIHSRRLDLSADGTRLAGQDRLDTRGQDRLRRDVPFSVHFHLHPDTACDIAAGEDGAVIRLRNGQRWHFRATGARMSLEESIFFTGSSGPKPSLQIVLRGACGGNAEVNWQAVLHQDDPPPAETAAGDAETGTIP